MSDLAWIDAALTSARPQALGALLRYFRDLDRAEEAFQEACLRALRHWPVNGPPRDPAAWLILVGRNAALDEVRRRSSEEPLPADDLISDLEDAEAALAERLDDSHYRDDVLRLLFICCHPDLPATQQIALALRIVSGRTVKEIAHAFLVSESAMEQRITRAKRRSPSGSTTRITATTCSACCSSAAIRICPQPSRSRSRCASCPASRSRRSRAPSW